VARGVASEIAAASLLANDSGDGVVITGVKGAVGARVRLEPDGDIAIVATTRQAQARFTYTIEDRFGQTGEAVVRVGVVPPPDARPDLLIAEAGKARLIEARDLLANDIGAGLVVARVLDATGRELPRTAGGDFRLGGASAGEVVLAYEIQGIGGSDRSTIRVDVRSGPDVREIESPQAGDDTATICSNRVLRLGTAELLGNDQGSALLIREVGGAENGSVRREGDDILFTPRRGFVGEAGFTYTLADGLGRTDQGAVSIDVLPALIAIDDRAATARDTALALAPRQLLANDSGAEPRLIAVSGAVNGKVALAEGKVVFTPKAGFVGEAGFDYRIEDAAGCRDTGHVAVSVVDERPVPTAGDDRLTACGDRDLVIDPATLLANDTGIALEVVGVGAASNGTVRLDAGKVVFTPSAGFVGEAQFTYRIEDGFDLRDTARVSVDVLPPPVADDEAVATLRDTPLVIAADQLLAGDVGEGLRIVGVGGAVNGSVRLDGTDVVFTPAAGFSGDAAFFYRVEDADGCRDRGDVSVDVIDPTKGRPIDVLLLTDLQRSFAPEALEQTLPGVADDIVDTVRGIVPSSRFALASFIDDPVPPFGDPDSDHTYRLDRALTADAGALRDAIGSLEVGDGGDEPMSTLDALVEALQDPDVGFASNAGRVVIVTTIHSFHFDGDGRGGSYVSIGALRDLLEAQDVRPIFAVDDRVSGMFDGLVDALGRGTVVPFEDDGAELANAIQAELARILGGSAGAGDLLGIPDS
jgi:hypothetical protein